MSKTATLDRAGLIARVKEIAGRLGKPRVTRAEFWRETGIPLSAVQRQFKSYSDFVRAAGLSDPNDRQKISQESLLRNMRDVFRSEGGIVRQNRFDRIGLHAVNTYRLRFGSWRRAIAALRTWLERHEPNFPYLAELRAYCDRGVHLSQAGSMAAKTVGGRRYGALLRFRALEHAPVNESGVIFLFGLVAEELGFIVEALSLDFPDADAKRCVGNEWRRVRLEFEYQSRSFQKHAHDPKACDLIVCWEHNWPQCPIEVLELKTAIRALRPGGSS
jgi:hypothetical protein